MKSLILAFSVIGFAVIAFLVGISLFRDPYIMIYHPEQILKGADVVVVSESGPYRGKREYVLRHGISEIHASGKLNDDSILIPVICFPWNNSLPSSYVIVNNILLLSFFKIIVVLMALFFMVLLFLELPLRRRDRVRNLAL
jgi:hypothetical protein